eukprot:3936864-Rhodomonas_salina.4
MSTHAHTFYPAHRVTHTGCQHTHAHIHFVSLRTHSSSECAHTASAHTDTTCTHTQCQTLHVSTDRRQDQGVLTRTTTCARRGEQTPAQDQTRHASETFAMLASGTCVTVIVIG